MNDLNLISNVYREIKSIHHVKKSSEQKKLQDLIRRLEIDLLEETTIAEQKILRKISTRLLRIKKNEGLHLKTSHQIDKLVAKTDQLGYVQLKKIHLALNREEASKHVAILDALEQLISDVVSRKELSLLQDISCQLSQLESKENSSKIRKLREKIQHLTLHQIGHSPSSTPFTFILFSDFDADDQNGAIISQATKIIEAEQQAFFITSSLLSAVGLASNERGSSAKKSLLHKALESHFDQWDVYQAGDIYLFLPKNQELKNLGITQSRLVKIDNWRQVVAGSQNKLIIEDFIQLFNKKAKIPKRMCLDGHGGGGALQFVGSLLPANYQKLIAFMNESHGEFLAINSCRVGGLNALKLYGEGERKEAMPATFPILLGAIGATYSYSEFRPEIIDQLLNGIHNVLLSSSTNFAETEEQYSQAFSDFSKHYSGGQLTLEEHLLSAKQAKLPSKTPRGFRPLASQSSFNKSLHDEILVITNLMGRQQIDALEIYSVHLLATLPFLVKFPIQIQSLHSNQNAPILHSSIPGNAHHWFKEMQIPARVSFKTFIQTNNAFHQSNNDRKAFFIQNLVIGFTTYSQVAILFSNGQCTYLFTQNDQFFCNESEISKEEFAFLTYSIAQDTTPIQEAFLSAGILDSEELFRSALEENKSENFLFYRKLANLSSLPVDVQEEIQFLPDSTKSKFLEAAIKDNKTFLASFLLQLPLNDLAHCDYRNLPLEGLIAEQNNVKLMQLFLQKADTPVHLAQALEIACLRGHQEMVSYLLEQMSDLADSWPILENCLRGNQLHVLETVLASGKININSLSPSGRTALHFTINTRNKPMAFLLLDSGIDVNFGEPPPVFSAIQMRDEDLVEELIETHSANLQRTDQNGNSVLHVAAEKGNVATLQLLLSRNESHLEAKNSKGETPLLAAFRSGLMVNADLLLSRGSNIQVKDNEGKNVFFYAFLNKDYDLIEKLFKQGGRIDLDQELVDGLLKKEMDDNKLPSKQTLKSIKNLLKASRSPSLSTDLLKQLYKNHQSLFKIYLKKNGRVSFEFMIFLVKENDQKALKTCLKHGAHINGVDPAPSSIDSLTLLDQARRANNPSMIQFLIENGADLLLERKLPFVEEKASFLETCIKTNPHLALFCLDYLPLEKLERPIALMIVNSNDRNLQLGLIRKGYDFIAAGFFDQLIAFGHTNLLKDYLMTSPLKVDINSQPYLLKAIVKNRKSIVLLLLEYGADPLLEDKEGRSAIQLLIERKEEDLLQSCLNKTSLSSEEKQGYLAKI